MSGVQRSLRVKECMMSLRPSVRVAVHLTAMALLVAGCSGNSAGSDNGSGLGARDDAGLPQLRSVPKVTGVELTPQDLATLPAGKQGADYNAIPPCELVKWPVAEDVAGMAFETEEGYNAEHEFRYCESAGDNGETMIVTTRMDRQPSHQLYDGIQALLEEQDSYQSYDGNLPGSVATCMWMEVWDSDTINGLACRTAGNVTVQITFRNGADPGKLVEMMEYGLAVTDLYYDEYYSGHN